MTAILIFIKTALLIVLTIALFAALALWLGADLAAPAARAFGPCPEGACFFAIF